MHTKAQLIEDLRKLGVQDGDALFVKAGLRPVGRTEGRAKETILNAFLEAIGPNGTLIGTTFTAQYPFFKMDKDYVFDMDTPSKDGAFSNMMLKHPDAMRSSHPTNSFVAIGKHAKDVVAGHDETALSYSPTRKFVDLDGRFLVIGCITDSPGFMTVHLVQEEMGLTQKSVLSNLVKVQYKKDGEIKVFKRRDIGGCSMGFHKMYNHYIQDQTLQIGNFGNAYSLSIKAQDSYRVDKEIIGNNRRYPFCDNPDCFFCRGTWLYNKRDWLSFYPRAIFKKLLGKVRTTAD